MAYTEATRRSRTEHTLLQPASGKHGAWLTLGHMRGAQAHAGGASTHGKHGGGRKHMWAAQVAHAWRKLRHHAGGSNGTRVCRAGGTHMAQNGAARRWHRWHRCVHTQVVHAWRIRTEATRMGHTWARWAHGELRVDKIVTHATQLGCEAVGESRRDLRTYRFGVLGRELIAKRTHWGVWPSQPPLPPPPTTSSSAPFQANYKG